MKYFNKKTGKIVVLSPSKGEYLVKFKEGVQGENLMKNISQLERLKSTKWAPKDFLSIVVFEEEATRTQALKSNLDKLNQDEDVEAVIPLFVDEEGFKRLVVPKKLLIAYKSDMDSALKKLLKKFKIVKKGRFNNWFIVELPDDMELEQTIEYFNSLPAVEYCEPVYHSVNDAENIDLSLSLKWNLEEMNVNDAWAITKGSSEIVVAIIDGSPDINHPSLKHLFPGDLPSEWSFTDSQTLSSHATQILSILAGQYSDVRGLCPDTSFIPLSVSLDAGYYYERAEAIYYLASIIEKGEIDNKPVKRIIANCSWKTSGDVGVIRDAFKKAASSGVIFVTSAGNENTSGPHYPSDYSETIKGVFSVAALGPGSKKADYSNYSPTVSISAPGGAGLPFDIDDIYCADLNNQNSFVAGTSFAAPHLSGTIALILSISPNMDASDIKGILDRTVVPLSETNPEYWRLLGSGKLNTGDALKETSRCLASAVPQPSQPSSPTSIPASQPSSPPSIPAETPECGGPKIDIKLSEDTGLDSDIDKYIKEIGERISSEIQQVLKIEGNKYSSIRITLETDRSFIIVWQA